MEVFARQFVLPASVVVAFALWGVLGDRLWPARAHSAYRRQLAGLRDRTRPAYTFEYVCQRQKIGAEDAADARCIVGTGHAGPPNILLWGDSNAAHYVGMLGSFARQGDFRFRNLEVGACPPILGDPTPFVDARRALDCRASAAVVAPLLRGAQVVIISAAWPSYQGKSDRFFDTMFDTVRRIAGSGKQVILLGKVPVIERFDRLCPEKALTFPLLACPRVTQPMSDDVASANARLRRFADVTPRVRYFDATRYLCPNGDCSPYGRDGAPLYYDHSHLAMSGSWKLGKDILAAEGVPAAFRFPAN